MTFRNPIVVYTYPVVNSLLIFVIIIRDCMLIILP